MEACLEVMKTDALVGIQDMGAAGLTCSTSEMSSRGAHGMDVDVSHVPAARNRHDAVRDHAVRVAGAHAARASHKGREHEVEAVFEKWDLHAVRVGHVTDAGRVRLHHHGVLVADMPKRALTDEGPVYRRPMRAPVVADDVQHLDLARAAGAAVVAGGVRRAARLARPSASKRWAYQQYDHTVGTNTIAQPGTDAGVVRIKDADAAARRVGRRQRPLLLSRSASRRHAGRGRGGAQRRLRRRRADRRHQQPELRQPRAARDHVAVRRGRARHRRRLPGARRAHHRRQRQPLQRDRGRGPSIPTPVLGVVGLLPDASRT